MLLMKTCNKCDTEKPVLEFYKHKTGRFGVSSICKSCKNRYSKNYRENFVYKTFSINTTKVCSKCFIEKAISDFRNNKGGKFGVKSVCAVCDSLRKKIYYNKPEVKSRILKSNAEYDKKFKKHMLEN